MLAIYENFFNNGNSAYVHMCMGYVGGNCVNPSDPCSTMYGGYTYDYTGWVIKCVSDP